jgi:hypothetical protein
MPRLLEICAAHESLRGPSATLLDVSCLVAIGGKADISRTWSEGGLDGPHWPTNGRGPLGMAPARRRRHASLLGAVVEAAPNAPAATAEAARGMSFRLCRGAWGQLSQFGCCSLDHAAYGDSSRLLWRGKKDPSCKKPRDRRGLFTCPVLTYMATIEDAVKAEVLEPYQLPDWESRLPIRP